MLEIGLGCAMEYGPGKSATVWRAYFPSSELWFADVDAVCVAQHKAKLDAMQIQVVTGDQSSVETLHDWVNKTGGSFDVIIDDGGHTNEQIYNTFMVLFPHALKVQEP